jgi:hypothetical protein
MLRSKLRMRLLYLRGQQHSLFQTAYFILFYRVRKRKKVEPTPRNAFPHVVEKVSSTLNAESKSDEIFPSMQGLVSDVEARELYHMYGDQPDILQEAYLLSPYPV